MLDLLPCSLSTDDYRVEHPDTAGRRHRSLVATDDARGTEEALAAWVAEPAIQTILRRGDDPRRALDRDIARLRILLDEDPIEDGVEHNAATELDELVSKYGDQVLSPLLREVGQGSTQSLGDLVQCLGRIDASRALPWGLKVVREALQHPSVRVRSGAVKAIEHWRTREALDLLREHAEPTAWLAEHVRKLLATR